MSLRRISLTVSPDTATGTLKPDDPPGSPTYVAEHIGNALVWYLAETGGAPLHVEAPGYLPVDTRALLPAGSNELPWGEPGHEQAIPLDLVPLAPSLVMPHIEGRSFVANGQPWQWAMMTGFWDYYLFLEGRTSELLEVLAESRELGANGRRVLGMVHWSDPDGIDFKPQPYGDAYYQRLPEFVALENSYGQIPEFEVFASAQDQMKEVADQQHHLSRMVHASQGQNLFLSCGNEWNNNGFDPKDFLQFLPGVIYSRGSSTSEAEIPQPPANYAAFHERRDLFKGIGRGYKAQEACWNFGYNIPFVFNELIGADEVDQPGRRSANPDIFAALAAQYRAVGAGVTFHSQQGLRSRLLGPRARDCATAFYAALA